MLYDVPLPNHPNRALCLLFLMRLLIQTLSTYGIMEGKKHLFSLSQLLAWMNMLLISPAAVGAEQNCNCCLYMMFCLLLSAFSRHAELY